MNNSEILEKAADYLDGKNWQRYGTRKYDGSAVCVRGAIFGALGIEALFNDGYHETVKKVDTLCQDVLGPRLGMCAELWNDTECKSKEEALRMLREAAAYYAEQPDVGVRVQEPVLPVCV